MSSHRFHSALWGLAHGCFWIVLAAWSGMASAQSQDRLPDEPVGSWILSCPMTVGQPCIMRHRDWLMAPANGSPSAALEIQLRGDIMVPVVTVRGLPSMAALGGSALIKPNMTMGFDGGRKMNMACDASASAYSCAPEAPMVPVFGGLLNGVFFARTWSHDQFNCSFKVGVGSTSMLQASCNAL